MDPGSKKKGVKPRQSAYVSVRGKDFLAFLSFSAST